MAAPDPNTRLPHALITGAGSGIGAAITRALAGQGHAVTLLGRRRDALDAVARSLPVGAAFTIVTADIADPAAISAAFAAARDAQGPLGILINNAGQAESAPFTRTSLDLWQRMLQVNLTGTFVCTQAALPDMLAQGHGRIVNIASTAAQRGYAYVAAYAAAKHGVLGLTRSLALEVARKGITVNAVCPGYTDTAILRTTIANIAAKTGRSEAQARDDLASTNPQGRIVQPDEVAATVLWLCSEGAASVTGQAISVAGGEVM